jgi:hypothetical protein
MFRTTASASALMTLLGCATAQPVATTATPVPVVVAEPARDPAADFAGLWYVSGVFPTAARQASVADPHLGAALVIDSGEVSDVNGQRCVTPTFQADKTDAQGLGLKAAPAGKWDRLLVSCDGKAFATYVLVPVKSGLGNAAPPARPALLQLRPEALYLLEQADDLFHRLPSDVQIEDVALKGGLAPALEAALPEPAPAKEVAKTAPVELTPKLAPMPVPEGPVPEGPAPAGPVAAKTATPSVTPTGGAKIPAPGTALHLASYKGESAAKRGWKILLGEYDELDPLSPLYVAVDVPGKGSIIRLYATGADEAGLSKICTALKAKKVYCALKP